MSTAGVVEAETAIASQTPEAYVAQRPSAVILILDVGNQLTPNSPYLEPFVGMSSESGTLWSRLHRGVFNVPKQSGHVMRNALAPHYWPVLNGLKRLGLFQEGGYRHLSSRGAKIASSLVKRSQSSETAFVRALSDLRKSVVDKLVRELVWSDAETGDEQRWVFRRIMHEGMIDQVDLDAAFFARFQVRNDAVLKHHLTNLGQLLTFSNGFYQLSAVGELVRIASK